VNSKTENRKKFQQMNFDHVLDQLLFVHCQLERRMAIKLTKSHNPTWIRGLARDIPEANCEAVKRITNT